MNQLENLYLWQYQRKQKTLNKGYAKLIPCNNTNDNTEVSIIDLFNLHELHVAEILGLSD